MYFSCAVAKCICPGAAGALPTAASKVSRARSSSASARACCRAVYQRHSKPARARMSTTAAVRQMSPLCLPRSSALWASVWRNSSVLSSRRLICGMAASIPTGGGSGLGQALDENQFGPALRPLADPHIVHEGAHQQQPAPGGFQQILLRQRIGNVGQLEPAPLIQQADDQAVRLEGIGEEDLLVALHAVAVVQRVDDALPHRHGHVMDFGFVIAQRFGQALGHQLGQIDGLPGRLQSDADGFGSRHRASRALMIALAAGAGNRACSSVARWAAGGLSSAPAVRRVCPCCSNSTAPPSSASKPIWWMWRWTSAPAAWANLLSWACPTRPCGKAANASKPP